MQYSAIKPESSWKPDRRLEEIEYFQSCYPESMKQLQTYVAAECDQMDYPDSPIYDEYPDQTMIRQVCQRICNSIPEEVGRCLREAAPLTGVAKEPASTEVEEVEVYEVMQRRPPQGPPPWGPPPRPPQGRRRGEHRQDRHRAAAVGHHRQDRHRAAAVGHHRQDRHRAAAMGSTAKTATGPPPWGPPSRPPQSNWLEDVIRLLFLNEIQNRRCRNGRCR